MKFLVVIFVLLLIIYFIVRSRRANKVSGADDSAISSEKGNQSSVEADVPKDYLEMASNYLKTPKPLSQMLVENPTEVFHNLVKFLSDQGDYQRKYAAYALGQIGDPEFIAPLEDAAQQESKSGVREAMEAAVVALREAPATEGFSEIDRRRIIKREYGM